MKLPYQLIAVIMTALFSASMAQAANKPTIKSIKVDYHKEIKELREAQEQIVMDMVDARSRIEKFEKQMNEQKRDIASKKGEAAYDKSLNELEAAKEEVEFLTEEKRELAAQEDILIKKMSANMLAQEPKVKKTIKKSKRR